MWRHRCALKPSTDVAFVAYVLGGKAGLEVALLPRNDEERHQRERWKKHDQHADTVDPRSESDLQERESEIDGISAEAVGARVNNDDRGAVPWHGSAGLAERTH